MLQKRTLMVVTALIILVAGISWRNHRQPVANHNNTTTTTPQKYTHVDVKLEDGNLVGPVSSYLVNPGTGLEFSVSSNKLGKIGVPTDPPKIITFTQSPLVFSFITTAKAGSYPLTYQADGSTKVIEIGIITVRSTK